jgi:L-amino acid N-acyltransferase YncA
MLKCMEKYPWLLAYDQETNEMVGYAYAGIFKDRAAYRSTFLSYLPPLSLSHTHIHCLFHCFRWSVESSIYVSSSYSRRGIATKLYDTLFTFLQVMNIVNIVAVIALPNEASVQLHERYDFKKIGIFTNIGYKHENWIDVVYMQKTLQEPQYHSIVGDENLALDDGGGGGGDGRGGGGGGIPEPEREMVEPLAYPECIQKFQEILRLMG